MPGTSIAGIVGWLTGITLAITRNLGPNLGCSGLPLWVWAPYIDLSSEKKQATLCDGAVDIESLMMLHAKP